LYTNRGAPQSARGSMGHGEALKYNKGNNKGDGKN